MIAQTYLNGFLQHARRSDDPAVMLALQNFCLDNLKKSIETAAANKKAVDQLRNINDFWFFAAIISAVMQEIQFKIEKAFYLKDATECKEILDKLSEDAQNRLAEINNQYELYIASQMLIQQRLNQANIDSILKQRESTIEDIRQLALEINLLRTNLQSVNETISLDFNKIIADVSVASYEFKIENQTISISQNEIAAEMKVEFGDDLQNGTLRLNNLEDRVFNRFKNIHDRKIAEKNLNPAEHAEQSEHFARNSANTWVAKFRAHEVFNKLEKNIAIRDSLNAELEDKKRKEQELQQEMKFLDQSLGNLDYSDQLVKEKIQNREELREEVFEQEISDETDTEDDAIDPFADDRPEQDMQNDNGPHDPSDDNFQSPANQPDEPRPVPSDNSPDYKFSKEEHSPNEDKLGALNTPPPDNTIPKVPPPQYSDDKSADASEINDKSDEAEINVPPKDLSKQENIKLTDEPGKDEKVKPSIEASSRAKIYGAPNPVKIEQAKPPNVSSSLSDQEPKKSFSTTASVTDFLAKEKAKNPSKASSTKPIQSESKDIDENKSDKPSVSAESSPVTPEIKIEKISDDKKLDEEPESTSSPKPGKH